MVEDSGGNWFEDDPEWDELRKRVDGQPIPKKPRKEAKITSDRLDSDAVDDGEITTKKVDISLNLSVPKIKIPKIPKFEKISKYVAKLPDVKKYLNVKYLKSHKKVAIPVGLSLILVFGLTTFVATKTKSVKPNDTSGVLADVSQKPDFTVLLPKDSKSASKLQYDATKKVANFTDKIDFTDITVSQQPLPETFKSDPDAKLAELAKNINANEIISEANPKAYLGTSIKGPQTVVFQKNGLLVFITAPEALDKSAWAAYITKLL